MPNDLKQAGARLRNAVARRALAAQLAWGASSGLALAFYPLHFVGDLRTGFARMAAFGSGLAALRTFAAPAWERILKKLGAGSVLVACAVGLSLSPALWFFAKDGVLWLLAVDAALCGVLTAGYSLTASSLPIADSRRLCVGGRPRDRTRRHSGRGTRPRPRHARGPGRGYAAALRPGRAGQDHRGAARSADRST